LRRPRQKDTEGADVTRWGTLFQVRSAATGKARSPTVDSRRQREYLIIYSFKMKSGFDASQTLFIQNTTYSDNEQH